MLPSGGSITVVLPFKIWSPLNSKPSSSSTRHRWLAAWPGVCSTINVWLIWPSAALSVRVSCSLFCSVRSGVKALAARAVGADGRPRIGGWGQPACTHRACKGCAPGEWSGCEWVHTIMRMSPPAALYSRARWSASAGPGSMAM